MRLLSIHKSKGLEWPFVIVPDLSKKFNTDDLKKPVMFHPYTGIGLRLRQQDTHAELRTQLQQAIILQTRQELRSEEVRKLYVAMTRAREKLILVMSDRNMGKKVEKIATETSGAPTAQWLAQQSDAMSWVIAALLTHPGCSELRGLCPETLPLAEDSRAEDLVCRLLTDGEEGEESAAPALPDAVQTGDTGEDYGPLLARSRASYAHWEAARLPSKLTPTGLRALVPDSGEIFGLPQQAKARDHRLHPLEQPDKKALLRGSAMHVLLHRADLAACTDEQAVLEQADRLTEQGYLSQEERQQVWPQPIAAFARSELGKRTLNASKVLREYEFSVLLDAGELLEKGPAGEDVLLNGAIDLLLFEGDGMTVIDFKTDRVQPGGEGEQAKEHALQLALYKRAAEELFGLPVKEAWVWFLRTGTGVQV